MKTWHESKKTWHEKTQQNLECRPPAELIFKTSRLIEFNTTRQTKVFGNISQKILTDAKN